MGLWKTLFSAGEKVAEVTERSPKQAPEFSGLAIDPGVLYGVPTWASPAPQRVSRREAMRVPAVKRARDLIANSIGGLPLRLHDATGNVVPWPLFDQPEAGVAPSVTWTRVAEDLLFEGIAWLRVTHVGWHGYPVEVVRLDPTSVTVQPDWKVYYSPTGNGIATHWVPDEQLIRIDSPNDPLLVAGADAIRTCLALGQTTTKAASALPPVAVFTPAENVDPDPDEVAEALKRWTLARKAGNPIGYLGAALKLQSLGWNPEQLQLDKLHDEAVLEIARLSGIDPEELGVSTTSRTYFNAFDRKQNFIEFTLKGYLLAIAGRMSMASTSPRGFTARHDLDEFFMADTKSRYEAYEIGLRVGAITDDEVRHAEGRPPLTPAERARERELRNIGEQAAPKEIAS